MVDENNMMCFSSINLEEPIINKSSIKSKITLNKINGKNANFIIELKYDNDINKEHLPIIKLAFVMPLLNYGLFSKRFLLNFPISKSDLDLLNRLNLVFSRDIFVNKILRRRTKYISQKYLPNEDLIKPSDAKPKSVFEPKNIIEDFNLSQKVDNNKCGILSSGGKESLLTYGLLKEIGRKVYPYYINESGGHWRTALSAYKYHKKIDSNTRRVWTNVDRFYNFMLDNLFFIRSDHRKLWADTYPIRLCIFPYYVFSLLPLFVENRIGNLLIGSEFDDLRSKPEYKGINHYYGIYDQHQDFDKVMNNWYAKRIPGLKQWSAVRNVSGLIVEKILVQRYPDLAKYQRSCHSCHFEGKELAPCGKCSKCMGVLLFLLANRSNPEIMNFKKEHINSFYERVSPSNLRLDQDEKDQSFYLLGEKSKIKKISPVDHVEKIHINKHTCDPQTIPKNLRNDILKILSEYTTGYCIMKNEKWETIKNPEIYIK